MSIVKIDAGILLEMFANGYRNLCRKEAQVNDLNVFPVPDGDTGSNMAKTLSGGVHAQMQEDDDVSASMKKFSKAVLLSARGNSGVILSQFIKGLSIASDGKSVMVPSDITPFLKQGVDSAYKAVANPVEGTMLTVLRETYEACEDTEEFADFESGFAYVLKEIFTRYSPLRSSTSPRIGYSISVRTILFVALASYSSESICIAKRRMSITAPTVRTMRRKILYLTYPLSITTQSF